MGGYQRGVVNFQKGKIERIGGGIDCGWFGGPVGVVMVLLMLMAVAGTSM